MANNWRFVCSELSIDEERNGDSITYTFAPNSKDHNLIYNIYVTDSKGCGYATTYTVPYESGPTPPEPPTPTDYEYSSTTSSVCQSMTELQYNVSLRRPKNSSAQWEVYNSSLTSTIEYSDVCTEFSSTTYDKMYYSDTIKLMRYNVQVRRPKDSSASWERIPNTEEEIYKLELASDDFFCVGVLKYEKYKGYDKVNGQWIYNGYTERGHYIDDYSDLCTEWRYAEDSGYLCDDDAHIKYVKKKLQYRPKDGSQNWRFVHLYDPTATVFHGHEVYERGDVIERDSLDCKYVPDPRWVSYSACDGYDYCEFEKRQVWDVDNRKYIDDTSEGSVRKLRVLEERSCEHCDSPCYYTVESDVAYSVIFLNPNSRIGTKKERSHLTNTFDYDTSCNYSTMIIRAFYEDGKAFNTDVIMHCNETITVNDTPNSLLKYINIDAHCSDATNYGFAKFVCTLSLVDSSDNEIVLLRSRQFVNSPCSETDETQSWITYVYEPIDLSCSLPNPIETYSFKIFFDDLSLKRRSEDNRNVCAETIQATNILGNCKIRGEARPSQYTDDGKLYFLFPMDEESIGNLTINLWKGRV